MVALVDGHAMPCHAMPHQTCVLNAKIEVGAQLRRYVDTPGCDGCRLEIPKGTDICALLEVGDPRKGVPKLLFVEYELGGKMHELRLQVGVKGEPGTAEDIALRPPMMQEGGDRSSRLRDR